MAENATRVERTLSSGDAPAPGKSCKALREEAFLATCAAEHTEPLPGDSLTRKPGGTRVSYEGGGSRLLRLRSTFESGGRLLRAKVDF